MFLTSDFQNFNKTLLCVPKKIFPVPPPSLRISQKTFFFFSEKNIHSRVFEKKLWFQTKCLEGHKFLQNFSPYRGGGDTDKRKLWIATAVDSVRVHEIFSDQSTYVNDYNF